MSKKETDRDADTAPVVTGPRAPKRILTLDVPEYPNFTLDVWANHPRWIVDELTSGDAARIETALRKVILAHNGWCDDEGNPYPPADHPDFYKAIPNELLNFVYHLRYQATVQSPNSHMARRTN